MKTALMASLLLTMVFPLTGCGDLTYEQVQVMSQYCIKRGMTPKQVMNGWSGSGKYTAYVRCQDANERTYPIPLDIATKEYRP